MKILFDTDIGSDIEDALALLLLLRCPGAELVGVTTVYGCTDIRAKVAKKILLAAGHSAPVVAGLCTPFESPKPVWHTGTEGVGILSEEERDGPLVSMGIGEGAEDFIPGFRKSSYSAHAAPGTGRIEAAEPCRITDLTGLNETG